nr:caspase family protein [Myxococcus sp. RHSTA-1-4]
MLLVPAAPAHGQTPGAPAGITAARPYYRTTWAVVVGVGNYYTDINVPPLATALNDAEAMRRLLIEEFGYEPAHVLFLPDASRARIEGAFTGWLRQQGVRAEDSVLFYFAGHGIMTKDGQGYLAGVDARAGGIASTWVSIAWLVEQLGALAPRHKAIILDSCFSGSLFSQIPRTSIPTRADLKSSAPGTRGPPAPPSPAGARAPGAAHLDNYFYYLTQPAFVGMSAGRLRVVSDGGPGDGHSHFTSALLEVLRNRADSARKDHAFTFRQAAAQVETVVANRFGSAQIPNWGLVRDTGDGDFIFRPVRYRPTPTEARELALRKARYATDLLAARVALAARNTGRAQSLLERHLPSPTESDLRGFEWRHLWRRLHPETTLYFPPLQGQPLPAEAPPAHLFPLASQPTHELVAVSLEFYAWAPGQVIVFKVSDGQFRELFRIEGSASALAFSADGHTLAVGRSAPRGESDPPQYATVELFSVPDGKSVKTLTLYKRFVSGLSLSRDGQRVAALLGDSVGVWSTITGQLLFKRGATFFTGGLALTEDAEVLAFSDAHQIHVCEVRGGGCSLLGNHPDAVLGLRFLQGSRELVSYGVGRALHIWQLATRRAQVLKTRESPDEVVVAPEGGAFHVRLRDGEVWTWARGDKALSLFEASTGKLVGMAPLRDGNLLLAGEDGGLRILGRSPRAAAHVFSAPVSHTRSAFAPGARLLAAFKSTEGVQLWDTNTGTKRWSITLPEPSTVGVLAFSPDGGRLAVGGSATSDNTGWVSIVDTSTGQRLGSVDGIQDGVSTLAFTADGGSLVVAGSPSEDPRAPVVVGHVDLEHHVHHPKSPRTEVYTLDCSPDGRSVATGDRDGAVRVHAGLELEPGAPLLTYDTAVSSVRFSRDGQTLVSASWNGLAHVSELAGDRRRTTLVGHLGAIFSTALSPDGTTVATGADDGTLRLWKSSGEWVGVDDTYTSPVHALQFSRDGLTLAAHEISGRVRVLRGAEDTEVLRFFQEAHAHRPTEQSRRLLVQACWASYLASIRTPDTPHQTRARLLEQAMTVLLQGRAEATLPAEEARWLWEIREALKSSGQ